MSALSHNYHNLEKQNAYILHKGLHFRHISLGYLKSGFPFQIELPKKGSFSRLLFLDALAVK